METIVKIKWDEPKEQAWLNADNISLALHSYCKNTKFEVESVKANRFDAMVREKIAETKTSEIVNDMIQDQAICIKENVKYDPSEYKAKLNFLFIELTNKIDIQTVTIRELMNDKHPDRAVVGQAGIADDKLNDEIYKAWLRNGGDKTEADVLLAEVDKKLLK